MTVKGLFSECGQNFNAAITIDFMWFYYEA